MKIVQSLLLVLVPVVVMLAIPVTAHAQCNASNSYFPISVGHYVTYQGLPIGTNPAQQWKLTVTGVSTSAPYKVTMDVKNVTTPTTPTAQAEITCVGGGFLFDFASAFAGPTGVKITSLTGTTIPAPSFFTVTTPPSTWTEDVQMVANNGPFSVTMNVHEVHTIVGQSNMPWTINNATNPLPTWHVHVDVTTKVVSSTIPGGAGSIPQTTSSNDQWIVAGVGVVRAGSNGKYIDMIAHN